MKESLVKDLFSGITVGIVALPLALAFGIASGAGAAAGLYTAIVAGLLAGVFGGSRYQVSGPTGAMTVVLVGVVAEFGVRGMLVAGFLAGLIQVALGLLRLGGIVKLIPHSVVVGFTNGIAVVIFLGQLKNIQAGPWVVLVTVLAILATKRWAPKLPASLVGLMIGTGFYWLAGQTGPTVAPIPPVLPKVALPSFDLATLRHLIKPALEIAMLGCIESLLSAAVADNMTKSSHDSNRELIGQGLANIGAALVGGVPATGAIARTAVNIKSGGQTRLVSVIHSIVLLIILLFLSPYTAFVPLAALAGILAVTCYNMVEWESLRLMKTAPRSYSLVLVVTTLATIFTDLTMAVAIGVLLKVVIHTFEGGKLRLHEINDGRLSPESKAYLVEGPIFFGNTAQVNAVANIPAKAILLDMHRLHRMDVSGSLALQKLADKLHDDGKQLVIYGTPQDVREVMEGVLEDGFASRHLADDLDHALRRLSATELVAS